MLRTLELKLEPSNFTIPCGTCTFHVFRTCTLEYHPSLHFSVVDWRR